MSNHILMSLDNEIAVLDISGGSKGIKVVKVLNENLYPSFDIADWFSSRRIPASNLHARSLPVNYEELIEKSFYASLSDSYWVKKEESSITWKQINFFDNDFSDDLGEVLCSNEYSPSLKINTKTPTTSTNGVFPKMWKIIYGKRNLFKLRGNKSNRCHVHEVFASLVGYTLFHKLPVEFVPYWQCGDYCVCEDFVNPGEHYLPFGFSEYAIEGLIGKEMADIDKVKYHYQKLPYQLQMDGMLLLDYIIINCDRHTGNFGYIQDAQTMEIKKIAPIFDNGLSMSENFDIGKINTWKNDIFFCNPFIPIMDGQIKLVNLEPFKNNIKSLYYKISELIEECYSEELDKHFVRLLTMIIKERIEKVLTMVN